MQFVLLYGGAGGTPTYKGVVDYFQQRGIKFTRSQAVALGKVILQNVVIPIMSEVHSDKDWLSRHELAVVDKEEAEAPAATAEAEAPAAQRSLFDLAQEEAERNPNNPCCKYFANERSEEGDAAAAAVAAFLQ